MTAWAVVLLLAPALAEDGELRLVASGVDDATVLWVLDGVPLAETQDRQAITVHVSAGAHVLAAHSNATGRWQALARPDPVGDGATYVPAWTAIHQPAVPDGAAPTWRPLALPGFLAAIAFGLLAWPGRRGLEVLRRRPRA